MFKGLKKWSSHFFEKIAETTMTKFPGAVTCEKQDLTIPSEFTVTIYRKGKPPLHQ